MKHHFTCYDLIVFPKHYIYFLKRSQTSCFICISIILHILEVSLIIKGLKKVQMHHDDEHFNSDSPV